MYLTRWRDFLQTWLDKTDLNWAETFYPGEFFASSGAATQKFKRGERNERP